MADTAKLSETLPADGLWTGDVAVIFLTSPHARDWPKQSVRSRVILPKVSDDALDWRGRALEASYEQGGPSTISKIGLFA